jgi:uncharacterized protein YqjF (DUF2071 family)
MKRPTMQQREAMRCRPERGTVVMRQTWADLLFLHWPVTAETLQATLPKGLFIDEHQGSAWLGVVPFQMRNIRPRGLPAVPWLSFFNELNVRTYVHDAHGNPGVWFYSLDTDRWPAYKIARTFFKLPYFHAAMRSSMDTDGNIDYRCRRLGLESEEALYRYRAASGETVCAQPGTLEFFLVERYVLFSHHAGRSQLFAGRVHHAPYQYGAVELAQWSALPVAWDGLPQVLGPPVHTCVAAPVEVEVYPLERLA